MICDIDSHPFFAWPPECFLSLCTKRRKLFHHPIPFNKFKLMQTSFEPDLVKSFCQIRIVAKNGDIGQTKTSKKAIFFVWPTESSREDNVTSVLLRRTTMFLTV